MSRRQRHLGYVLLVLSLSCIALMTLLPAPGEAARAAATPLDCILCGDTGSVDFLLNILLFLPLGIGLGLAGFSWRRTLVLVALLSAGVELLQMKFIPGRDASLGDVLSNTLGGALGALLAARWRSLVFPDPHRSRRLALLYAVVLVWIWVGTAWALGPAYPQGVQWFGAWAPELGNYEVFTGRVLLVSAGGEPLLPGPALDQGRIADAVAARPTLSFRAVLGAPAVGLAPIGMIVDERQSTVALIGQDGNDLAFGVRMRTTIVKLRNPLAVLRGGLTGQPGDTVDAEGALRDGSFQLNSRVGQRLTSRRLPLSASWGWALVAPWDFGLGEQSDALTALWIFGLIAVLAYWSVLARGTAVAVVPVTMLLLFAVVPRAAGFLPAHWGEWAAAGFGALCGAMMASAARTSIVSPARPETGAGVES